MPELNHIDHDFLKQLTAIVEKNLSNEQFGVSELADQMNMSRSNLLRKVKKVTTLSVSQLIGQIRLNRGMELLRTTSLNVSEISHQVGFSSTSYFIKCFREFYGYPPGEVGKREAESASTSEIVAEVEGAVGPRQEKTYEKSVGKRSFKQKIFVTGVAGLVLLIVVGLLMYFTRLSSASDGVEKSVAVLPFINDSSDSTNIYLINGLMESTINNLEKINDVKVTSRTSVEKYRKTTLSIRDIAEELDVNYFVEGSGQKIGDQILLNIQLIDARTDRHLWAKQYRRQTDDIFDLQQEVAENIAEEIKAIITPEEKKRIEKNPTEDPVAYDYFLKGKDLFYQSTSESLNASIPWFKKAIERDPKFALAYANAAMVYYYLDIFQVEKKYAEALDAFADRAMLHDPHLGESLIAKGLSFAQRSEYTSALPYLEKALELNSNPGLVIHFLTEFYSIRVPDAVKYLKYALQGVKLEKGSKDSTTVCFKYFHLSNALIQNGFVDEALVYVDKSLAYDKNAPFSNYLKGWILFAKTRDYDQTKDLLSQELKRDTNRLDFIHAVGKIYYFMRDYKSAYQHFKKLVERRELLGLNIYPNEDLTIAIVFSKMGEEKKSAELVKRYKQFADGDKTIYKHMHLAIYHSWVGDVQKTVEHLKLFSKEDNFQYWILLHEIDPVFDAVKNNSEFKKVMADIVDKFWRTQRQTKIMLEEEKIL
jgi:TolB-like protein/AraC-like DNA-binding protein/Tfp pilus assembly protein PilF